MTVVSPLRALIDFLQADVDVAALVGTNVFGAEVPPGTTPSLGELDCIVIRRSGGPPPPGTARSYLPITRSRYDVHCYGRTPQTSEDVYLVTHSALRAMKPNVTNNAQLYNAIMEGGPLFGRDPQTNAPFTLAVYEIASADDSVT